MFIFPNFNQLNFKFENFNKLNPLPTGSSNPNSNSKATIPNTHFLRDGPRY